MGLTELQSTLARLYTDPDLLARFAQDPAAVQNGCGLANDDLDNLRSLCASQVEFFAMSLRRKRLGEVRSLLASTAKALGPRLWPLFDDFARASVPSGLRKHQEDACAFVEFLCDKRNDLPVWVLQLARYEREWILAAMRGPGLTVRRFDYAVDLIEEDIKCHASALRSMPAAKSGCFCVWLRWGRRGRLRFAALRFRRA